MSIIKVCNCDKPITPMGLWPTTANLITYSHIESDGSFEMVRGIPVAIHADRYHCPGCNTYFSIVTNHIPFQPAPNSWPRLKEPA